MTETASATTLQGRLQSEDNVRELIGKAQEWAILHGVLLRPADNVNSTSVVEHAAMTLFPSLMPAKILKKARDLQVHFNRLMHRVACDHESLESKLNNVITVDNFTKMLWHIYQAVRKEVICQPISLGLFRNDFMIDVQHDVQQNSDVMLNHTLKQIEFNTMAAGLGGLSSAIWKVHRYKFVACPSIPFSFVLNRTRSC